MTTLADRIDDVLVSLLQPQTLEALARALDAGVTPDELRHMADGPSLIGLAICAWVDRWEAQEHRRAAEVAPY